MSGRRSAIGAIMAHVRRRVSLELLRTDERTQLRAKRSEATLIEYAERMARGATGDVVDPDGQEWPAIVVYYDAEEGAYWVADGHHRVEAARRAGLDELQADVRNGTLRDAVLHAASANVGHGLRPSPADKRRAVVALLSDPEWSQWSDREIARRCGSSHPTVGIIRAELVAAGAVEPAPVRHTAQGRDMDISGIQQAAPPKVRKPGAQAQPPIIIKAEAGELSALPLERAADSARFGDLRSLAGAGVAVLLAEWSSREDLWSLASHGYDALGAGGALLLRAPQGEQLAWLVLQLHALTRDGRMAGPHLVILDGEIWATWTRGQVEIPQHVTSPDALAAYLQRGEGSLVRLASG